MTAKAQSVFVSYRQLKSDEIWKTRLVHSLTDVGVRRGELLWHDQDTRVGDQWMRKILASIDESKLAILLLSKAFFRSDFIMQHELPRIAKRHMAGNLIVYPVVLDTCKIKVPWINEIQLAHRNRPLNELAEPEWPESLRQIARDIRSRVLRPLASKHIRDRLPADQSPLLGRQGLLDQLDRAWTDDKLNVVSLIAPGGVGKTALVARWLQRMDSFDNQTPPINEVRSIKKRQRYFNGAKRVCGSP